jgi:two-component system LytT family response regulator
MPELDGLDVAAAVNGPHGPAIIFVTAFDQFALRAFDVHAVDYLVKPIAPERLREALACAGQRFAAAPMSQAPTAPRDRLLVPVDGKSILVTTADIDWIEAAGNYVKLHRGTSTLMLREPLASVEANIDSTQFVRVHRSAIVNVDRIKEVQPWFSGASILILTTGQRLTLSRSYRRRFEARFGIQTND